MQFPRLLAELAAEGALTSQMIVSLTESMDLEPDDIRELVEHAQSAWERTKRAWVVAGRSALELDTSSSASRQHYLETGEYLPVGEAETWSRDGVVSRCGDGRDVPHCQQLQAHDGAERYPVTTQSTSPTNGDTPQGATRCYVARIAWDVDGMTPREAAEAMWSNVRCSEGPVVDLLDEETGFHVSVDLAREPGDRDAMTSRHCQTRSAGAC